MAEDIKKNNQLVQAKTSSLQKRDSNIVSRGLSDLVLLDVEKAGIIEEEELLRANEWFKKGHEYNINGDYDKAIEAYTKAIALNPNDANAYYRRGVVYRNKEQYDRTIEDYTKAITLAQNYGDAYEGRGDIYYRKGQYDKAIEDYNKVIQLDPNGTQAYYYRGIAYYRLGNKNMAISDFQKACDLGLEIGCENLQKILQGEEKLLRAEEWFDKGYYHHRINKEYDKEIDAYTNAISLDPNLAKAYAHRGNAYYEKGQYDIAIEDYNNALGLNPYLTAVNYRRGLAYEMKGNIEMAISDFKKACDLGSEAGCKNLQRILRQK